MYVDPILSREVSLREKEKIKDMVNRLSKVDPNFAEFCDCGSGKAYGVCCGLDIDKVYSIMRRERILGEHITKDQAIKLYIASHQSQTHLDKHN